VPDSAARLLHLLSLLQARAQWTGAELAERLGVTDRTLRRDVERLRALDYPVSAVRGVAGGYRLGAGGTLPPLLLDDDEAVAVAVSLRTAANGSITGIADTAISALMKLEQVLPTRLRHRVGALHQSTAALPGWSATVEPDVLTALAAACRDRVAIRMAYTDHHGTASARLVEPHRLVHTGRRWYLVAHDVDRAAWRTFRADRVRDPRTTGVRFVHRDPPDAVEFVAAAITTGPYPYRARILFQAPARVLAERIASSVGVIEATGPDADTCILTVGSDSLDAIAMHLGVLDIGFTVLEPPELRARIQAVAERFQQALG
jgi:predicted DNA-binding transcriptional regulator YafY